jgi:hypothetical protein
LLDIFSFEVVEADFVDKGVEGGRFDSEDGFKIEALRLLVQIMLRGVVALRQAYYPACRASPRP